MNRLGMRHEPDVRTTPGKIIPAFKSCPLHFAATRYLFTAMFANLLALIAGTPTPEIEQRAFVEEVRVTEREPRNPKVERLILVCWILIAVKHVLIIWACHRYPVPFHQLWINFPTWLLGVLATGLYYGRVWRK